MAKEDARGLDVEASLNKYFDHLSGFDPIRSVGRIEKARGLLLESYGPHMFVGEIGRVHPSFGKPFLVEAIGLKGHRNNLMPYEDGASIEVGDRVVGLGSTLMAPVGPSLLGRVIDGLGQPIDGKGPIYPERLVSIFQESPKALEREPISEQIQTGVRAIDSMMPLGKGQRIGIFSGSGVGKSTLMGMVARNTSADINVITLIGERGREVREFIDNELGPEGLKRSVLIVSTSDKTPLSRVRGAYLACTIAEYFRDLGNDVMFLFDSVTRFAMGQREIGLANGEPPTVRGYTPSVFSQLPKILERSGNTGRGSITGVYTVLVEGDDIEEPISDAVRGILDGHIILARELAERAHYPAIDVLKSVSRLAPKIQGKELQSKISYMRSMLAAYRDASDLLKVGAYVRGSDPLVDEAINKRELLEEFFRQDVYQNSTIEQTNRALEQIIIGG
ncbi:MAG: FliI/YscN family ATPase [Spirochaetia bacterium]